MSVIHSLNVMRMWPTLKDKTAKQRPTFTSNHIDQNPSNLLPIQTIPCWKQKHLMLKIHRFVVPESPRWLLVKGRTDDVKKIVEATAKFNNKPLPNDYASKLKPPPGTNQNGIEDNASFMSLFRVKYLRRITLCFLSIWFIMNLVYYGIILNMSTFGGNVYLNTVGCFCSTMFQTNIWLALFQ